MMRTEKARRRFVLGVILVIIWFLVPFLFWPAWDYWATMLGMVILAAMLPVFAGFGWLMYRGAGAIADWIDRGER